MLKTGGCSMLNLLKDGTKLYSKHRTTYTVTRFIASGGQGEVYEVTAKGHHYALKWYYKHSAVPYQHKLIERLRSEEHTS